MYDESATHIATSRSPQRRTTRRLRSTTVAVAVAAVSWMFCTTSTTLAADPTVQVATNATLGPILVDSSGQALYVYAGDHSTTATCTGACAQTWPPLTVSVGTTPTAGPGITGTVTAAPQSDGTYQVAYNGSPLYTFVGDSSPGQVTGNGVAGFSILKVAATPTTSAPASPTVPATQTTAAQGQTPQAPPTTNSVTPAAGAAAPTSSAGTSAPTSASTPAGSSATGSGAPTPAPATSSTGSAPSSSSGANAAGPAGSLASTGPSAALLWVAVLGVGLFVIGLVPLVWGSDFVSVVRRRVRGAR